MLRATLCGVNPKSGTESPLGPIPSRFVGAGVTRSAVGEADNRPLAAMIPMVQPVPVGSEPHFRTSEPDRPVKRQTEGQVLP